MIKTRFAPSPTGFLHLGHIYAAKIAYDLAKDNDGQFLVRFEDIDTTRTREHFYQATLEDLEWLGFPPDLPPIKQTDRLTDYDAALETLKQLGVIYPCFCTRKDIQRELASITNAPHSSDGPLYPQICRNLTTQDIEKHLSAGKTPAWRINTDLAYKLTGDLSFTDQIHGEIKVNPQLLGDTILARKDIGTSYHIAVVVDDAFQEITHVTRGDDLLPATHLHRTLQELLKLPAPEYLHHKLILDDTGERLAKRNESLSIQALIEQGFTRDQVLAMLD